MGLDVSRKETSICVIDGDGKRIGQGKCASHPDDLEEVIRKRARQAVRRAIETDPLCVWHWHALRQANLPVVGLPARQAKAALMMQLNKTDPNDAHGLAQIVRCGWYREVEVKSMESHRVRLLLTARRRLVSIRTTLYNQIRGLVKGFGLVLAPGKGEALVREVEENMPSDPVVQTVINSLLSAWKTITRELKKLDHEMGKVVRDSELHKNLMTILGVGVITAAAYVATVDCPERFSHAKDVGAYLGLTPRRDQSGEVDRTGRVSKCGDGMLRALLLEAAPALLTRTRHPSTPANLGFRAGQENGTGKGEGGGRPQAGRHYASAVVGGNGLPSQRGTFCCGLAL